MKKISLIIAVAGFSFAAHAITIKNNWNEPIFVFPVSTAGQLKGVTRIDGKKTANVSATSGDTSVIAIAAWNMKRVGKGFRGNYYRCRTTAFMVERIEGVHLDAPFVTVDHQETKVKGKKQHRFSLTYGPDVAQTTVGAKKKK